RIVKHDLLWSFRLVKDHLCVPHLDRPERLVAARVNHIGGIRLVAAAGVVHHARIQDLLEHEHAIESGCFRNVLRRSALAVGLDVHRNGRSLFLLDETLRDLVGRLIEHPELLLGLARHESRAVLAERDDSALHREARFPRQRIFASVGGRRRVSCVGCRWLRRSRACRSRCKQDRPRDAPHSMRALHRTSAEFRHFDCCDRCSKNTGSAGRAAPGPRAPRLVEPASTEYNWLMDLSPILNGLNDAQRAAVTSPLAPTLVLAGAGSGKTRVLTHRVAWLVQVERVSPHSILAVTFTNKAAGEMRGRIESLLGLQRAPLWIGTFHGIAHRLLRLHWREANLPQAFQVMDAEDQMRAIRRVLKSLNLDEARWVPKEVMWFINARKDEGLRPH